ncbi:MAG: hydroxyacid dehydrogenase [Parcubacteria group bacterium]|jgi:D-lactate dehydrogenase
MNIAFFEVQLWKQEYLNKQLKGHTLLFFEEALSEDNVEKVKSCEVISVFIHSKITEEILTLLPNLKFIATQSTGFDHIDVAACTARKIAVSNVPYYGENTVAEHTFALILALSRNVHKSYVRTLQGNYAIDGLMGFDLQGKTLGVIGTGHIGLHVIRIAKGFGMHVVAYDVKEDPFLAEVLRFKYVPLEEVATSADIISLHLPYNAATHHIINGNILAKVKPGALIINTSRGSLIDSNALLTALDAKRVGGAALDVLEGEELILDEKQLLHYKQPNEKLEELAKNHILLKRDNVVFTPHIAFFSKEALERILSTTAENILAFAKGEMNNIISA